MRIIETILILIIVSMLCVSPSLAQGQDDLFGEDIIELEEITIQVEPELPTVIVTPVRQNPVIVEGSLKPPIEKMISEPITPIKPQLLQVEVLQVEKPQNILAKDR